MAPDVIVFLLMVICGEINGQPANAYRSEPPRTQYACDGGTVTIDCSHDHVILILRANYGRFQYDVCNQSGDTEHWDLGCMSTRSLRVVSELCDDLRSCSVPAAVSLFGDPCPNTYKYLEIQFVCEAEDFTERNVALTSRGATCTASSVHSSSGSACELAIDGFPDYARDWATQGEGVGSWIQIDFVAQFTLTLCRLMQRFNHGGQNEDVELSFSNGATQAATLTQRSGNGIEDFTSMWYDDIALPRVSTTYMKVTVLSVYTTGNNGFVAVECYEERVAGYEYVLFPPYATLAAKSHLDAVGYQVFVFADQSIPQNGTVTSWRIFVDRTDTDSMVMVFRQTSPGSESFLVVGSLSGAMSSTGYYEDVSTYLDVQAGDFLGLLWGAQNPLTYDDVTCSSPQYSLEGASTMDAGNTYTIPVSEFCRSYAMQVVIRIEIDECESSPCQNGGTCVDDMNGFNCTCVEPYVGPTCGAGPSQNVALASNGATCSANTQFSSSHACEESIDGDLIPVSGWVTDGMGVGAWMQINFASQQVLTYCRFMQVTDTNEQFEEVELSFSGGVTENVTLTRRMGSSNTDTDNVWWDERVLDNITTGFVRIGAISVYTTDNNGFIEVEFYTAGDDECASSPCGGASVCIDGENAFVCSCSAGYTGVNCETDINECMSSPCQNGGTCLDQVNGYTCSCPSGYGGARCHLHRGMINTPVTINVK